MLSGEEGQGSIDHGNGFGNDAGAAAEAGEPVAQSAVEPFDRNSLVFADAMSADRQPLGIGAKIIGAVQPDIPALQAWEELVQRGGITAAAFPIDEALAMAIQSQPDPERVRFF